MVVLKKIKAASLVETITASTLLIILFVIASMILNNIFFNTLRKDTTEIRNYTQKLIYGYQNKTVDNTSTYRFKNWEVTIEKLNQNQLEWVEFRAINSQTKAKFSKRILDETN